MSGALRGRVAVLVVGAGIGAALLAGLASEVRIVRADDVRQCVITYADVAPLVETPIDPMIYHYVGACGDRMRTNIVKTGRLCTKAVIYLNFWVPTGPGPPRVTRDPRVSARHSAERWLSTDVKLSTCGVVNQDNLQWQRRQTIKQKMRAT